MTCKDIVLLYDRILAKARALPLSWLAACCCSLP